MTNILIGGNHVAKTMGVRQEGWAEFEDELLAKTVIDYVQNGKTQLLAFEEAAKKLNFTPHVCAFRWNSSLRKRYDEEMKAAKEQKALLPPKKYYTKKVVSIQERMPLSVQQVLEMLQAFVSDYENVKREVNIFKKQQQNPESLHFSVDDVEVMASLFKRARDQNLLEEGNQPKSVFKMDNNGNLERL